MAQLQMLAERGSRRARAELDQRLRNMAPGASPVAAAAPAVPARPPVSAAATGVAGAQRVAAAPKVPSIPTLTERADDAAAPARTAPAVGVADVADQGAVRRDNEALALQLMAQHSSDRVRADGPPRLVGMVLIAWGVLLLMGSLTMITRAAGWYYLYCAVGAAAVGWLLMRCNRWAMALHGALLLVALGWAWRSSATPTLGLALAQSAPLLVAALWMAVRSVREPLE